MSDTKASKVKAKLFIDLTLNQKAALEPMINDLRTFGGIIVAGLILQGEELKVGFRLLPEKLGAEIIKIADDYYDYGGETDVNG